MRKDGKARVSWHFASAKLAELMAVIDVLDRRPGPCADVGANMKSIVINLCADPVAAAMVGYLAMREQCQTGPPSKNSATELKTFGALVRIIRDRLDAFDNLAIDDADKPPTVH